MRSEVTLRMLLLGKDLKNKAKKSFSLIGCTIIDKNYRIVLKVVLKLFLQLLTKLSQKLSTKLTPK